MILAALGAAVLVALVVVTIVVYATRPSSNLAATATSTTELPTTPSTTARPTTTTAPSTTTSSSEVPVDSSTTAPRSSTTTDGSDDTKGWFTYTAPTGVFSVRFPSKPETQNLSMKSLLPKASGFEVAALTTRGKARYVAGSFDAGVRLAVDDLQDLSRGFATVLGPTAKITDSEQTTIQGHDAVTFSASANGEAIDGVLVIDGTTMIVLEASHTADTDAFFGSLRIS
jgi:hypothetical protein